MTADNDAKIRRWEQYIEESRKEAKLLSPEGQQELQTVIHSYEKLIAIAREQANQKHEGRYRPTLSSHGPVAEEG